MSDTVKRMQELGELVRSGRSGEVQTALAAEPALASAVDDAARLLFHWAALSDTPDLLQLLYSANPAALDARDDSGATAIALAASAGRTNNLRRLLAWGADPRLPNHNGQTALHYAASRNRVDEARELLAKGADPKVQDKYGATALHRCASQGHRHIVHLLLETKGVAVDVQDAVGNSALHLACEEGREDVAAVLAKNGARLDLPNKEEKTPLDLAQPALRRQLQLLHKAIGEA